jgi:hypothetical protein
MRPPTPFAASSADASADPFQCLPQNVAKVRQYMRSHWSHHRQGFRGRQARPLFLVLAPESPARSRLLDEFPAHVRRALTTPDP